MPLSSTLPGTRSPGDLVSPAADMNLIADAVREIRSGVAPLGVTSVEAHGHSLVAHFGTTLAKYGFGERLAKSLGAVALTNTAISGGLAAGAAYQAGPTAMLGSAGWDTDLTAGPYFSPGGLKLIMLGYNDGVLYGLDGAANALIENALQTVLAVASAARKVPAQTNASTLNPALTFSSGWTAYADTGALVSMGPGIPYQAAAGSYVEMALDAAYNGEAITAIIPLNGSASNQFAATLSVGGVTKATFDIRANNIGTKVTSGNSGYATLSIRIPKGTLPAGAQTIRYTLSAVTGGTYGTFGGFIIEGEPPILLPLVPRRPAGGPNVIGGTAAQFNLNAAYSNARNLAVAPLFPHALTVNLEPAMCPNIGTGAEVLDDRYWFDVAHPNNLGSGRIAGLLINAARGFLSSSNVGLMS